MLGALRRTQRARSQRTRAPARVRLTLRLRALWVLGCCLATLLGCPALALALTPDAGALDAGALDGGADAAVADAAATPAAAPSELAPSLLGGQGLAPLPPVEPDPRLAPVIEGEPVAPRAVVPLRERPELVIKTIIGLLVLLTLAYLGGHPRVVGWEERLGVSQLITAGFPFVILGLLARTPSIGVLTDSVLAEISPLLRLGLGWIGFVIGFRFDTRLFQGLPPGTARLVSLSTALPFACVLGASGLVLYLLTGDVSQLSLQDPVFLRDALILGTAGAMTARTATRLIQPSESSSLATVARITRLEELAGIIGLSIVAAFFRPQGAGVSWQIPGMAWLLLTVGLGAATGVLIYAILQRRSSGADFLVLTLGSISFAAGAAGYLLLSSVVVAFIAGVLLANFPGSYHERLREILRRVERPMYLLSLVIVGALWQIDDWRGWLLMPIFAGMRLAGKWLAAYLAGRIGLQLGPDEREALALSPIGALSIAIVINAQLLYPGGSISLIVSAVIGGAILTEVLLQFLSRKRRARNSDPASPRLRSLSPAPVASGDPTPGKES
jgi:Kef-type K+ transport system membrane component KefB